MLESLKQLGLAAHNFHDVYQASATGIQRWFDCRYALGPSYYQWTERHIWAVPWLGVNAYLLPYMEQQTLYDNIFLEFNPDKYINDPAKPGPELR